jgi:hypothetical protein
MQIKKVSKVTLLLMGIIVLIGCESKKPKVVVAPPAKVTQKVAVATTSVKDIRNANFGKISVEGKKSYSSNQPIQFAIDTNKKTGYLYIVYLDNNGETALLYPNAKSPLTELNGKYVFPRDFGGMKINATKECKGCKQEKTTVYAILSKDRIADISKISASDLGSQSKGLKMDLDTNVAKNSNINVGKIEFFVK